MRRSFIILSVFSCLIITGVVAQSKEISVGRDQNTQSPLENRYAFIVGIDHYEDTEHISSFTSCRIDATKFEGFLKNSKGWMLPKNKIEVLLDPKKDKIVSSFQKFLNTIPNPEISTVYFYFSGHGLRDYLVPKDYYVGETDKLISYEWLLGELEKRNIAAQVFILDACHSGSLLSSLKSTAGFEGEYLEFMNETKQKDKKIAFTATSANRTTAAGKNVSVFTYNLLEVLENESNDENGDNILSSGEVYDALYEKLETSNPPQFSGSRAFPMANFNNSLSQTPEVEVNLHSEILKVEVQSCGLGKYGVKNLWTNEWVLPPNSYEILPYSEGLAALQLDDKWGFIDTNGDIVIPAKYENVNSFRNGIASIKMNGKWGAINKNGEVIIPVRYEYLGYFSEGLINARSGSTYIFIDINNNEILKTHYTWLSSLRNGLALIEENGKYGFINKNGHQIIPPRFDNASDFKGEMALVKEKDKWGFIDETGKSVIPFQYSEILPVYDGYIQVKKNGLYGYINRSGEVLIEPKYDFIDYIKCSESFRPLIEVEKSGKYGFVNHSGEEVIRTIYDHVRSYNGKFACLKKDGKFGFLNNQGKISIPFKYDDARGFRHGRAAVKRLGKWGYINEFGREVIPLKFDNAGPHLEGLAIVYKGGKGGFIDTNGKIIIPLEYSSVAGFKNGTSKVKKNGKYFYIDKSGKCVKNCPE